MINSIKIPVMILTIAVFIFLPKTSFAYDNQHGHDRGSPHHERGGHRFVNPDLTLVSGMETVDSRVLIATDPDPTPEVVEQSAPMVVVNPPNQMITASTGDTFIINVPNNAGGYTPVRIIKSESGYLGPQGELYYPFPDVAQLKAIYGI